MDDDDPTDGVTRSDAGEALAAAGEARSEPAGDEPSTSPPARAKPPLVPTTSEPPAKMTAFLLQPAAQALKKAEYDLAVSYYRALVAARGNGDPIALELAQSYRLASQYGEAIQIYEAFAAATADADAAARARRDAETLRNTPAPFATEFASRAAREAVEAYNLGRRAFKKERYADALLYFRVASELNPDLPGPVREIGATYQQLGMAGETLPFYLEYLRRRPFGKLADEVRKRLGKLDKDALGMLSLASKLPCQAVVVERQLVPKRLPIKRMSMAPGRYKFLCINRDYALGYYETAEVERGKPTELEFRWAVLVNQLANPPGRIVLEDARRPGVMKDLGLTSPELGVLVPDDDRALKMVLRAADRSGRTEERFVRLKPGQREVIAWSDR
jgi:tetratricopeptide (TPR) repeat protein